MVATAARVLFVLAVCGVIFSPQAVRAAPAGEEQWLELELRGWAPTLSGSMRSSNGSPGTDLDYDEVLGLDTQRNFYWPRATFHFAEDHRLTASLLRMQYAGDSTLSKQFTFGGTTFTVGEAIHSELELTDLTVGYQFDLLKFSRFSTNLNVQTHVLNFDAKVRGNTLGSVREDFTLPVPTIGAGVRIWPFEWLELSGDFNILRVEVSSIEGEVIDSEAAVTISPWDWVGFTAGYRYFRGLVRGSDAKDQFDWLQQGPFVGIVVRPF